MTHFGLCESGVIQVDAFVVAVWEAAYVLVGQEAEHEQDVELKAEYGRESVLGAEYVAAVGRDVAVCHCLEGRLVVLEWKHCAQVCALVGQVAVVIEGLNQILLQNSLLPRECG